MAEEGLQESYGPWIIVEAHFKVRGLTAPYGFWTAWSATLDRFGIILGSDPAVGAVEFRAGPYKYTVDSLEAFGLLRDIPTDPRIHAFSGKGFSAKLI